MLPSTRSGPRLRADRSAEARAPAARQSGGAGHSARSEVARRRRPAPTSTTRRSGGIHVRILHDTLPAGVVSRGRDSGGRPLEEVDPTLRKLALALSIISLGGVALAVWLGRMVARAALRPVGELTEAAEHVARTRDLSRRMEAAGSDELSRLGASFNTMLEALDESQRHSASSSRRLTRAAHAAHQPAHQHRGARRCGSLPPDDRRRLLRDVVEPARGADRLVTDLVDLARGEEPELEIEDVRLDLLVAEAVERARRRAHDKQFSLDSNPAWSVASRPASTARSSNLLDNAAKWSPAGGPIEVTFSEESSPSATTVRASTRRTSRSSSTASTARPRRAACRARASVSRSFVRSPSRTAAACRRSRHAAEALSCGCAPTLAATPPTPAGTLEDQRSDATVMPLPERTSGGLLRRKQPSLLGSIPSRKDPVPQTA